MPYFTWSKKLKMSFQQLLLYGVHIGHSFKNSWVFSGWLVFNYYQNILFINLLKTWKSWQLGVFLIEEATYYRSPIWFINFDGTVDHFIRNAARNCGEYACTSNWIHGLASNYESFHNVFCKYIKGERSWDANKAIFKKGLKNFYSDEWNFTRHAYPRLFFISNVHRSYTPSKEAFYAEAAALGIVDTNTYSQMVNLPIPANDDSLDCLVFYNEFVSSFILLRKFYVIMRWYYSTRAKSRYNQFFWWIHEKMNKKKKNVLGKFNLRLTSLGNFKHILHYGLNFFASRHLLLTGSKEQIDIYYKRDVLDPSYMYTTLSNNSEYFLNLFLFSVYSYKWQEGQYLQKQFFREEHMLKRLLKKRNFRKRIMNNKFWKYHYLDKLLIQDAFLNWTLRYYFFQSYFNYIDPSRLGVSKISFNSIFFRLTALHLGIFLFPYVKHNFKNYFNTNDNFLNNENYFKLNTKVSNPRYFYLFELEFNHFTFPVWDRYNRLEERVLNNKLDSKFKTDLLNIRTFTQLRIFNILNDNFDNTILYLLDNHKENKFKYNISFLFGNKNAPRDLLFWSRGPWKDKDNYFIQNFQKYTYYDYHTKPKYYLNSYYFFLKDYINKYSFFMKKKTKDLSIFFKSIFTISKKILRYNLNFSYDRSINAYILHSFLNYIKKIWSIKINQIEIKYKKKSIFNSFYLISKKKPLLIIEYV